MKYLNNLSLKAAISYRYYRNRLKWVIQIKNRKSQYLFLEKLLFKLKQLYNQEMWRLFKWVRNKAKRLVKDPYFFLFRKSLNNPLIINNKGKANFFISQFYPPLLEVDLLDIFKNINILPWFTIVRDIIVVTLGSPQGSPQTPLRQLPVIYQRHVPVVYSLYDPRGLTSLRICLSY